MVLVFIILFASAAAYKPVPRPKCGLNEVAVPCKTICPPQSCNISYTEYACPPSKCEPGCDCLHDFFRNDDGVCVHSDNCPPPPSSPPSGITCGENEVAVPCKTVCPPQSCNISYTDYFCEPTPCEPGCDCILDYLRNEKNVCVLNENCPPAPTTPTVPEEPPTESEVTCGENEVAVSCQSECPPQDCDKANTTSLCDPNPNRKCIPGCEYRKGYLRDAVKKCIPVENCPKIPVVPPTESQPSNEGSSAATAFASASSSADGGLAQSSAKASSTSSSSTTGSRQFSSASSIASSNSSSSSYPSVPGTGGGLDRDCTYNRCTPTCSLPYQNSCPADSNPCNCPPGSVVSEVGGQCVPREECQKYINCEGDYNATVSNCPIACPSTCAKPDAKYCNTQCGTNGCICQPGYILSEKNGNCIKPEDCPGGNACKKNETFVNCLIKCLNSYCPVDDRRYILICDPPYPCPSGCACKANYLRKSRDEDVCILASECPPVECTRPNEEWNPCSKPYFSDSCRDRNKVTAPGDSPSYAPTCNPQCVCKQGFYRNGTDICVTAHECPTDEN